MARWWWFLLFSLVSADCFPEVTAPAGHIRGIREGPNEEVHVFRGIPYAEPPVGPLRWRPPRPMKRWEGLLNASSYGNSCVNHCTNSDMTDFSSKGGDEDCLYLNVYAPREATNTSQLPCLVWVHGGAFEFGTSNEYNGSTLVSFWRSRESPALLVTLNYRLNIFGFLGSDQLRDRDPLRSTGNYGLQDQRMALQWVQENIAAFGGDPSKVLLFGQSSGAAAISMHLVMPNSYGLYSKALMQSGAFGGWSAQHMQRKEFWFQQLMNQTKCKNVDCLVALSQEELLLAYMAIPDGHCCEKLSVPGAAPEVPWSATIDGVELTALPWDLLRKGKVNKVPMLIGSTLDDGARTCRVDQNLSAQDFLRLFQDTHPMSLPPPQLYSAKPIVPGYGEGYWSSVRVATDQNWFCPGHWASRILAKSSPVYEYIWAHGLGGTPIVTHSTDLPFVFMELPADASSEEKQLAADVAMSWYHFAASGQPKAPDLWPALSATEAPMLKFQVESKGGVHVIDGNFRDPQCSFSMEWMNKHLRGQLDEPIEL